MTSPSHDQLRRALRERGLRTTRERLELFDEIYTHHGHLDAEQLWRSLSERGAKISRASVYRNLDLLVDCGFVRKQMLGGRQAMYEHQHEGQRHDHLVCRRCGRVVEFVSPAIAALQREICRAHGFEPTAHQLEIRSHCVDCASRQ